MANDISFKSYCWVVGTTSYRTDNFNLNIEQQLALLDEFRDIEDNRDVSWIGNNEFQKKYYHFLKERDFVKGDATRPDKDAREKTSGLVDIGLLNDNRELTVAGRALLEVSKSGDFSSNNFLEIPKDSFIYFKQLLKTSNVVDKNIVRPFIVFLYVINKTGYLTNDEFTYLLPLCVNKEITEKIIKEIIESRAEQADYNQIIWNVLSEMGNYKEALELLQTESINEDLICTIGINRKSKKYDKPYFNLYKILERIVFAGDEAALDLYEATKKITNSKVTGAWRKYFFSSRVRSVIKREGNNIFNPVKILKSKNIEEFNYEFFKIVHVFKAKATLSDYFDLNRRYFRVTDTVIFEDGQVKLDILPKCYTDNIGESLSSIAFIESEALTDNCSLEDINSSLEVDVDKLYKTLGQMLGRDISNVVSARRIITDDRYRRFNKMIDEKFDKEVIIQLLFDFEVRNDDNIREIVTDNADIPTIFEYILGIAWYIISDRKGKVLDYMNLSLDANLLPKTHAGGGEADIVWEYDKTECYPEHTLLIEATLADGTNQRRMEMEPVSRHLGDYCLANPEKIAYCAFITTYLNVNVISDFRARKHMEYFNTSDLEDMIEGMKILPMQTTELKNLLHNDVKYCDVFNMFDKAYVATGSTKDWYNTYIVREISTFDKYKG